MEIPKGSMVGHNQSVYVLKAPVEARKYNSCKIVIKEKVRARCVSPNNKKGLVNTFYKGTIFSYR